MCATGGATDSARPFYGHLRRSAHKLASNLRDAIGQVSPPYPALVWLKTLFIHTQVTHLYGGSDSCRNAEPQIDLKALPRTSEVSRDTPHRRPVARTLEVLPYTGNFQGGQYRMINTLAGIIL